MTPLDHSYATCRAINRRHGTTYYWSTTLLPAPTRPHVHALYAFCRHADDIVDALDDAPVARRADALARLGERFRADLRAGRSDDPVLAAVVDTVRRFDLDPGGFDRFLHAMTMDLSVAEYETFDDLCGYMDGSAAVIGELMLPLLQGARTSPDALHPARTLGIAFQLTNFLRDVGEDLLRGRVYLPQEDLRAFGADPRARVVTDAWRELMRFEIARTRALYEQADLGIALLPERSARCIAAARILYSEILGQIERQDYDVFSRRATVSGPRKLAVVARAALGTLPTDRGRPVAS
jgi:phytoene synthase